MLSCRANDTVKSADEIKGIGRGIKPNNSTTKGGETMRATKGVYVRPVLTKHDLLRDITAGYSGNGAARDRIESVLCRFFPRLCR